MRGRGWFLTGFFLLSLAPAALLGQQTDAATPAPDETALRALAALQAELNAARDEFNAAIAAVHEVEARQEVQDEYRHTRAEIFAKHGWAESDYQGQIYVVSTDGTAREVFEHFVKEVIENPQPTADSRAP